MGYFPCPCAEYMYKIMILLNNSSKTTWPISTKLHVDPTVQTGLWVWSNGHTPLTVTPIYGKKKNNNKKNILIQNQELLKMILSLVTVTGLAECCITSAYLQWIFHSDEWAVALETLVPHSFTRNLLYILGKTGMSSIDLDQMPHFVCHSSSSFTHIYRQLNGLFEQKYSRTIARTSLGPCRFVRDLGSSSHWGLIIAQGQKANEHNLEMPFPSSIK